MRRYFNTEAQCDPEYHYMVNLNQRLEAIKKLVDRNKYFTVNRARQYGKTTTLLALKEYLKPDYTVIFLDFQKLSKEVFSGEECFSAAFVRMLREACEMQPDQALSAHISSLNAKCGRGEIRTLQQLFENLIPICRYASKPVVLIIDEVDTAANNQVFLDFLSQLRAYYINRKNVETFQSVILAGVYDVKNLKLKIRAEESHDKFNSPWNIAAKFSVKMDFSVDDISGMLKEYEDDNHTGMDVDAVSQTIYDYTSGYPWLVSAICKMLDEEVPDYEQFTQADCVWNDEGIAAAVKNMLKENIPLFESLIRQITRYPDLKAMLRDVIFRGRLIPFSPDVESINKGLMLGYLREKNNLVAIANRIFEMRLLNLFITEAAAESSAYEAGAHDSDRFIRNGRLDMELVLSAFVEYYEDIFAERDEKYLENFGREIFLMFLKPIINGTGNYYLESATRSMTRTDVVVDYLGEQYIIEMKLWHGQEYNRRGEKQLSEYLDFYHKKKGYMLSFNFNKNKVPGIQVIQTEGKVIFEAVV